MRNFHTVIALICVAPSWRQIWLAGFALLLGFVPATAQDNAPPTQPLSPELDQGRTMIEDGAQLLLRGLLAEMEPKLRELDEKWREISPQLEAIGPQLSAAAKLMGDLQNYQMPELLGNGDILIRRKETAPPFEPPAAPRPNMAPPSPSIGSDL